MYFIENFRHKTMNSEVSPVRKHNSMSTFGQEQIKVAWGPWLELRKGPYLK